MSCWIDIGPALNTLIVCILGCKETYLSSWQSQSRTVLQRPLLLSIYFPVLRPWNANDLWNQYKDKRVFPETYLCKQLWRWQKLTAWRVCHTMLLVSCIGTLKHSYFVCKCNAWTPKHQIRSTLTNDQGQRIVGVTSTFSSSRSHHSLAASLTEMSRLVKPDLMFWVPKFKHFLVFYNLPLGIFFQLIKNCMITEFKNKMKFPFSSKYFNEVHKVRVFQVLRNKYNN